MGFPLIYGLHWGFHMKIGIRVGERRHAQAAFKMVFDDAEIKIFQIWVCNVDEVYFSILIKNYFLNKIQAGIAT